MGYTNNLLKYDIYPKVYRANGSGKINIRVLDAALAFSGERKYAAAVTPVNFRICSESDIAETAYEVVPTDIYHMSFEATFGAEQDYQVRLYEVAADGTKKKLFYLDVYALEADYYGKIPLIGDFHAHTTFSDGKESPQFVAANYRRHNFDFLSITDHRRYEPSLIAIEAFRDIPTAFRLYPGEEVHSPHSGLHMVNFASDVSVNRQALKDETPEGWRDRTPKDSWTDDVEKIKATLSDADISEGANLTVVASAILASNRIREGGGMSILAHPHWLNNVRNVPDALTRYILENKITDAFELIGGQSYAENQTQTALYYDMVSKGIEIPIVGSSDEHGTLYLNCGDEAYPYHMFTEEQTVVLADANTREEIIDAVKNMRSAAVEVYRDNHPHIYGNYRMVQYTAFLWENYFPFRKELTAAEGRFIFDYLTGDRDALSDVGYIAEKTESFEKKYLGF